MLELIKDRRGREKVRARIDDLARDPEKQGKPLTGPLAGYYSVRAAGRYRIIYRVDQSEIVVFVVVVGIRKEKDKRDIYALTQKLFRLSLLDPHED